MWEATARSARNVGGVLGTKKEKPAGTPHKASRGHRVPDPNSRGDKTCTLKTMQKKQKRKVAEKKTRKYKKRPNSILCIYLFGRADKQNLKNVWTLFKISTFQQTAFTLFKTQILTRKKKMIQRKPKNDKNDNKLKTKSARKCQKILHLGEKFV